MRFFRTTLVALAATATTVNAGALRQYKQRSLVDACANVDAHLTLHDQVFGKIHLCLCVSAIPALLTTDHVVKSAVSVAGKAAVVAALKKLVHPIDCPDRPVHMTDMISTDQGRAGLS